MRAGNFPRIQLLTVFLAVAVWSSNANADLVGWWSFDGDLNDSSDGGNDGSGLDAETFDDNVPDAIGGGMSLRMNGERDGVLVEPNDNLESEEFTLAYFINPDGAAQSGGFERLTSRGSDSFETALSGSDELSYFNPSVAWNQTGIFVENEEWTHVAWRNDGSDMRLLVNGQEEFVGPGFTEPPIDLFKIGVRHNDIEGYEGLMDDVLLWDDTENPLSDQDIETIASSGVATFLGGGGAEDTDEDGILDRVEDENGCLDKNTPDADKDPDEDGLLNLAELSARTDPCEADTDGDTINDKAELDRKDGGEAAPTNPRKKDTDGDTLADNVETDTGTFVSATDTGTDPLRADSDDDGLTDGQEVAADLGTDPTKTDTDGDGFDDGAEVRAESDPKDASSIPTIGLVGWWPLDGTLNDRSESENHGEALIDENYEDSAPEVLGGQSLRFDGEADGVRIEAADNLDGNPFTLAYFINPEDAEQSGGFERLTSRGGDTFETAISSSNELSYFAPGTGWIGTGGVAEANEWTHVTWRTDGNNMELFVNGEEAFDGAPIPEEHPSSFMHIAIRHNNVEGYEGLMADVALWRGALPDDQIKTIAEGGVAALVGGASMAFQITAITYDAAESTATITWNSRTGRAYAIDFSEDLTTWLELEDGLIGEGTETSYITPKQEPDKYYRIREF